MLDRKESEDAAFVSTGQSRLLATPWLRRKRLLHLLPALLLMALLFLGGNELVHGQIGKITASQHAHTKVTSTDMTRQQVIAQARPAVVTITTVLCQGSTIEYGSGVIIDPRGYIVTNYHVVADGEKFFVTLFDDSSLQAQLIGIDPSDDLAVLKIETSKRLHAMSIGDSSQLQVGDDILAIGNPLDYPQTVTSGIISALGRTSAEKDGSDMLIDTIQHNASTNPGNSGGAVVNMQAQLVGIHTLHAVTTDDIPAQGIGFAIPSNRVKFIVPQLIQYGKVIHSDHSTIGVTTVSVDSELAEQDDLSVDHGAFIADVDSNGPAAQAGLKSGDVIVQVNNIPVNNATGLTDALMPEDPGSTVTLGIVRGTQLMQAQVTLKEQIIKVTPSEPCSNQESVPGKG